MKPKIQRHILPPSSGSKCEPIKMRRGSRYVPADPRSVSERRGATTQRSHSTWLLGRGHTKETGNRNATAISENCYQPEFDTCFWMEESNLRKLLCRFLNLSLYGCATCLASILIRNSEPVQLLRWLVASIIAAAQGSILAWSRGEQSDIGARFL
jgi:hypothetical protein